MAGKLVTKTLKYNRDNNLFLSVDQVEKLFYYLTAHYNLKDYAKYIRFYENPPFWGKDAIAEYFLPGKTIRFYKKNFDGSRKDLEDDYTITNDPFRNIFINEELIRSLIHELMHVSHIKTLFESTNYDPEFEVLKSTYIDLFVFNRLNLPYLEQYYGTSLKNYYGKDFRKFIKQVNQFNDLIIQDSVYEYDPAEINAEYESIKEMIRISEFFDLELSYMWEGVLLSIIEPLYTPGIRHVVSPYERFIKVRNRILTLDKINWRELDLFQLPLDKRLSYGLPITLVEYNEMEDHIMSLHL